MSELYLIKKSNKFSVKNGTTIVFKAKENHDITHGSICRLELPFKLEPVNSSTKIECSFHWRLADFLIQQGAVLLGVIQEKDKLIACISSLGSLSCIKADDEVLLGDAYSPHAFRQVKINKNITIL